MWFEIPAWTHHQKWHNNFCLLHFTTHACTLHTQRKCKYSHLNVYCIQNYFGFPANTDAIRLPCAQCTHINSLCQAWTLSHLDNKFKWNIHSILLSILSGLLIKKIPIYMYLGCLKEKKKNWNQLGEGLTSKINEKHFVFYVQWSINCSVSTYVFKILIIINIAQTKTYIRLSNVMEWTITKITITTATATKIETFSCSTVLTGHRSYRSQLVPIVLTKNENVHSFRILVLFQVWCKKTHERIWPFTHKKIDDDAVTASVRFGSICKYYSLKNKICNKSKQIG